MVAIVFSLAVAVAVLAVVAAVAHTFSFGHAGGSVSLSDQVTLSGAIATEASFSVPGSTTNQQQAIDFNQSNLQGVYIKTDQDVTLKTNSTGSPQETISLKAGIPFVWVKGAGVANPFAGNVTTTYWSNAGATAANVQVRTLVN